MSIFIFIQKPRPFGAALLIAGVDESGPRLFKTGKIKRNASIFKIDLKKDPSGTMIEY